MKSRIPGKAAWQTLAVSGLGLLLGSCPAPETEETPQPTETVTPASSPSPTPTPPVTPYPPGDKDEDGLPNAVDNCPTTGNLNQLDRDLDGQGDLCDPCPDDNPDDEDGDGQCGEVLFTPAPEPSFRFLAAFPADGGEAVSPSAYANLYFNGEYPGEDSAAHMTAVNQFEEVSSSVLYDGFFGLQAPTGFRADADTCVTFEIEHQDSVPAVWPMRRVSCFTTRVPCGLSFDVGRDIRFTQLGGNDLVLNTINPESGGQDLQEALLFRNLSASSPFPATVDVLLGSFYTDDWHAVNLSKSGYTAIFRDCTLDSQGHLSCRADQAYFSATRDYAYDLEFPVWLVDVTYTATVLTSGHVTSVTDVRLKGVAPAETISFWLLYYMMDQELPFLEPDVDLDGDGVKEAATLALEATGVPLNLSGATCAGE